MNFIRSAAAILLAWVAAAPAQALPITIDFESYADLDEVGASITGLTFGNALVLQAGLSLNEVEFPPRSGTAVISPNGADITVDFAAPVSSVSVYATYGSALTLNAFDASANLLGSVISLYGANLSGAGDLGSSPNELLSLVAPVGISRVVFTSASSSVVLDDFTYDSAVIRAVPSPGTASLLGVALLALGLADRRRARRAIAALMGAP